LSEERIPPSNIEAEEAVLGSILVDPQSLFDVAHIITHKDFFRETNGWIFRAMTELSRKNSPVDFITVTDELRRKNVLEEIGGEAYIIGLINVVPTSVNVVHYAKIVKSTAIRRQLIVAAGKAASGAFDEEEDIETVLAEAEKAIFDVAHTRQSRQATQIKEVASAHMERMEYLNETGGVDTIQTGFIDLDRLLSGGFERGSLILVPGDTGMGKSSMLISMATNMAQAGFGIAIYSLEMPNRQVFQRQVSAETRIPVRYFKTPHEMTDEQWGKYYESTGKLSELPVHIDDSGITPMSLLSKSRRIQLMYGLDVVFIDYLALVGTEANFNNETLRLASISRALKLIAMELDVVIVAAAQLNSKDIAKRQDKRPTLDAVRWSSDPNSDSDVVMFVYRDDYYNPETSQKPNITEVHVAKQREGPTGIVDLYWHAELMTLRNLQRQEIVLPDVGTTHAAKASEKYELDL
jgi:replicative DNA helicase